VLSALRLTAHVAGTGSLTNDTGGARFFWASASLELCVMRRRLSSAVRIDPCASFEAGLLRGTGEIAHPDTATRPWLAVGPTLGLEAALSAAWFLALRGGVTLALERDTFVFGPPRKEVYQPPVWGGFGSVGVGYRFGDQSAPIRP
jgi:hypothetical protein